MQIWKEALKYATEHKKAYCPKRHCGICENREDCEVNLYIRQDFTWYYVESSQYHQGFTEQEQKEYSVIPLVCLRADTTKKEFKELIEQWSLEGV
jgi:hypothetical protein